MQKLLEIKVKTLSLSSSDHIDPPNYVEYWT